MAVKQGGSVPATVFEAVTPSNSTNFTNGVCRGLYIGRAGNVCVVDVDGNAVLFSGAVAGSILPVQAIRVNSTTGGTTTATNIVALF